MSGSKSHKFPFDRVGQLLDFVISDGDKIKYLRVVISGQEYWVKLAKEARKSLDPAISPGCWLEMSGRGKYSRKTGKLKLKADFVRRVAAPAEPTETTFAPPPQPKAAKTKLLVCQKSGCAKRGGRAICQAIAGYLRDRDLEDRVEVKMTGCLKQCKQGPNLVVMPNKTRYSKIAPREIPALLDKHCTDERSLTASVG